MNSDLRILILEDVPTDAELIQFELREARITFIPKVVKDKKAYLTAIDEFSPESFLSDYSLPSFDGLSALKLAGGKCPDMPLYFCIGCSGRGNSH